MNSPGIFGSMGRRCFLSIGGGALGLGLADLLRLQAAENGPAANQDNGKSAIFIFLTGGQSHLDTWDLKPENGEVAGEFKPIQTNVPGIEISEHLPHLARQADKYLVLRSVSHTTGVHEPGQRYLRTGNRPIPSLSYPEYGCVTARERVSPRGIPPYIRFPIGNTGVVENAGYLGVQYKSFVVGDDPSDDNFSVRALATPGGLTLDRIDRRTAFMRQADTQFQGKLVRSQDLEGMDSFYQRAFEVLRSEKLRDAFDFAKVDDKVRDMYGRTHLGQACLLARRLVAAGVRFIGIDVGGWDTHDQNFERLKDRLLPPWDQGVAALIQDLDDHGLLDDTLVWSTGEFGRTPKINDNAGRDHWPRAMSMLLAGGGLKRGVAIGETDKEGAEPISQKCTPDDVAATFLHAMGIDHHSEYHTPDGRPVLLVRDGAPMRDLFA